MERKYSQEIAAAIRDFLTKDDWNFSFDEETGVFRFNVSLSGKMKEIRYHVITREDGILIYATAPIGADTDDADIMTKMAEFVCRANSGLRNGNFEFDFNDGEIRYKVYIACEEDTAPPESMLKTGMYFPGVIWKMYGDGVVSVLFGGATAEEAIAKCEE